MQPWLSCTVSAVVSLEMRSSRYLLRSAANGMNKRVDCVSCLGSNLSIIAKPIAKRSTVVENRMTQALLFSVMWACFGATLARKRGPTPKWTIPSLTTAQVPWFEKIEHVHEILEVWECDEPVKVHLNKSRKCISQKHKRCTLFHKRPNAKQKCAHYIQRQSTAEVRNYFKAVILWANCTS